MPFLYITNEKLDNLNQFNDYFFEFKDVQYNKTVDGVKFIIGSENGDSCKISITDKIRIESDFFGSKQIYYYHEGDKFNICTNYKQLSKKSKNVKKLFFNSVLTFGQDYFKEEKDYHKFDFSKYIMTFDEWENAFLNAVNIRVVDSKSFLALSGGYDSGAIALACKILDKKITYFSFSDNENYNILSQREKFLGKINFLKFNKASFLFHKTKVITECDNFIWPVCTYVYNSHLEDDSSYALSLMGEEAIKKGLTIGISGTGGDEIISSGGSIGVNVRFKKNYIGLFPKNLGEIYPWVGMYDDFKSSDFHKEESVFNMYNINNQYPFTDVKQIQAYFSLDADLKNLSYKAPLEHFFNKYNFSFEKNIKRGFFMRSILCTQ